MLCSRVQNLLSAYCDRETTGAEMLQIRSHLDACPDCRSEYQALRQVKLLLGALPAVQPARAFSCAELERRSPLRAPRPVRLLGCALAAGWHHATAAVQRVRVLTAAGYSTTPLAVAGVLTLVILTAGVAQQPQPTDTVSVLVPAHFAGEPAVASTGMANPGPLFERLPETPVYYLYSSETVSARYWSGDRTGRRYGGVVPAGYAGAQQEWGGR